jgi:hypothetical protein
VDKGFILGINPKLIIGDSKQGDRSRLNRLSSLWDKLMVEESVKASDPSHPEEAIKNLLHPATSSRPRLVSFDARGIS